MAREVDFADVLRRVREFGELATLVSVTEDRKPHTVTVLVEPTASRLVATVGPRTRLNLVAHPDVALVWFPTDGGGYQLILDGLAESIGDEQTEAPTTISIQVTKGILHRLSGREDAGPTCLALGED